MSDDHAPEAAPGSTARLDARTARLAEVLRGPFDIKSFSLTGLFVFALFGIMYLTRPVLLPLVLAILLSYLLSPLVRALHRTLRLPTMLGSGLVLALLFALTVSLVARLATPAAGWLEKAPVALQTLQGKLDGLKKPMQQASEASAAIEKITTPEGGGKGGGRQPAAVVVMKSSKVSDMLFTQTPEFLAETLMMLILLYFLLAYDEMFLGKLVKILPSLADKKRALTIAREIEQSISKYLLTVTCINAGLGTVIGAALGFLGMPNPVFWGALAAVVNYVPYLGATCGIIATTLGAFLLPGISGWHALAFPAAYLVIATLEGNVVTPMILGHSLTLNPIVILVSLMFWGWMWGIAGAILAVPILAVFKIFCDHVEPLAPVGEFLST